MENFYFITHISTWAFLAFLYSVSVWRFVLARRKFIALIHIIIPSLLRTFFPFFKIKTKDGDKTRGKSKMELSWICAKAKRYFSGFAASKYVPGRAGLRSGSNRRQRSRVSPKSTKTSQRTIETCVLRMHSDGLTPSIERGKRAREQVIEPTVKRRSKECDNEKTAKLLPIWCGFSPSTSSRSLVYRICHQQPECESRSVDSLNTNSWAHLCLTINYQILMNSVAFTHLDGPQCERREQIARLRKRSNQKMEN